MKTPTNLINALINAQIAAMEARERAKDQHGNGSPQHRAAAAKVDEIIKLRGKAPMPIKFDK